MSSRLQTAWTFSRVFLHNGACPAAVHIIACDYLPLMTHTTWELRVTESLKYSLEKKQQNGCSTVRLRQFDPYDCLWWLKTYADCIVEWLIWLSRSVCRTKCDKIKTIDFFCCMIRFLHESIPQEEQSSRKWMFSLEVSVPCPCAGGDNGRAMATDRPSANGGIIPLPISTGLNAVPHNHTPHKEVLHASLPGN